ncbi:MAG TPA: hypothetical protein VFW33_01855 [Gemmataceae bacterium]|nr:hypothetical protein [Gemmataceae bacterium]
MASEPTSLSEREERFGEIAFAYQRAKDEGARPDPEEWLARYPEFAPELASFIADQEVLDRLGAPLREVAAWTRTAGRTSPTSAWRGGSRRTAA